MGLLTVAVAVLGIMIAYFQWRTAHQRVVMDLFERRAAIFDEIERCTFKAVQAGSVDDTVFQSFANARAKARFLFGDDVQAYLDKVRDGFIFLSINTQEVIRQSHDRKALGEQRTNHMKELMAFPKEGVEVFGPYMRLDQKMTLWWPST